MRNIFTLSILILTFGYIEAKPRRPEFIATDYGDAFYDDYFLPALQSFYRGRRYNEDQNKRWSAKAALDFKTSKFFKNYRGGQKAKTSGQVNPNFDALSNNQARIAAARNAAKCAALQKAMGTSFKVKCNNDFSAEKFRQSLNLDTRIRTKKRSSGRRVKMRGSHRMKPKNKGRYRFRG